jgi:hypothetical protein
LEAAYCCPGPSSDENISHLTPPFDGYFPMKVAARFSEKAAIPSF